MAYSVALDKQTITKFQDIVGVTLKYDTVSIQYLRLSDGTITGKGASRSLFATLEDAELFVLLAAQIDDLTSRIRAVLIQQRALQIEMKPVAQFKSNRPSGFGTRRLQWLHDVQYNGKSEVFTAA